MTPFVGTKSLPAGHDSGSQNENQIWLHFRVPKVFPRAPESASRSAGQTCEADVPGRLVRPTCQADLPGRLARPACQAVLKEQGPKSFRAYYFRRMLASHPKACQQSVSSVRSFSKLCPACRQAAFQSAFGNKFINLFCSFKI